MSALDDLLDVQEHDTAADQLRHKHVTLPERALVESGNAEIARLDAAIAAVSEEVHEIGRAHV